MDTSNTTTPREPSVARQVRHLLIANRYPNTVTEVGHSAARIKCRFGKQEAWELANLVTVAIDLYARPDFKPGQGWGVYVRPFAGTQL